jgi:hypothetical protein
MSTKLSTELSDKLGSVNLSQHFAIQLQYTYESPQNLIYFPVCIHPISLEHPAEWVFQSFKNLCEWENTENLRSFYNAATDFHHTRGGMQIPPKRNIKVNNMIEPTRNI